jgi:threonine dehydrogenase-like Zn-dependent dehydrogenase
MCAVPRELRDVGVLVEPATIMEKALAQTRRIVQRLPWIGEACVRESRSSPGIEVFHDEIGRPFTALVLGSGAVGLLGAMALRAAGLDVYVYSRTPAPNAKSALVDALGAYYVSERDTSAKFAHLVGAVDFVYEAAGVSQLAFRAMKVLAPNSIFVFTGVPGLGASSHVDTDTIMRNLVLKNQVLVGTVNAGREDFVAAVAALGANVRQWPRATQGLITGRYPLDAYRDLLLGQAGGIKNVLSFDTAHTAAAPAK